jgi:hypothetical protein
MPCGRLSHGLNAKNGAEHSTSTLTNGAKHSTLTNGAEQATPTHGVERSSDTCRGGREGKGICRTGKAPGAWKADGGSKALFPTVAAFCRVPIQSRHQ